MTRGMCAARSCGLAAGVLALLLFVVPGGAGAASPDRADGRRVILSPQPDATLPARPTTIRVREPSGAELAALRLNGADVRRELRGGGRVGRLKASPSHGLQHGRNRVVVKVERKGQASRRQIVRFQVRRGGPLAAAGRDRRIGVEDRLRLNGARSRSHLTGRSGSRLDHRWKVVDAPKGVRPGAVLRRRGSIRPNLRPSVPGPYAVRLTVEAPDGRTGSDVVVVRATSATPHIDAVARELRERNPGTEGKVWGLSSANSLPDEWLLQTPDCWQTATCGAGPLPPSAKPITDRMTEIIAGAEHSVELSGLWPPPDGPYRDAIVDGLKQTVAAGNEPTVRVILGTPPTQFSDSQFTTWFNALVTDVGGGVPIQAAAMSTYRQTLPPVATSWNHSKVLAVDGGRAIVGGMNYWANDYMQVTDPVNDVTITLDGPAAADAVDFEDVLWGWICKNRSSSTYVSMRTSNVSGCVAKAETAPAPKDGDVPVLTLGRLGNGIDVPGQAGKQSPPIPKAKVQGSACSSFQRQVSDTNTNPEYEYRNPGETGLRALIGSAKSSIFISQQDLLGCVYSVEAYFDERVMAALAEKIVDGIPVTIVVAAEGAKAGGASYSNGYKLKDLATVLKQVVAAAKPSANARQLVCRGVALAGIRTLDAAKWPNGSPFANHAKVVWVDDAAFYVGSENLYPARLQELGMLVEDAAAAAEMKSNYLDPLWERSSKGALVDPARNVCGSF